MGEYCAFFYGTLMAPSVLYRITRGLHPSYSPSASDPSPLSVRPALLHGYVRHKVRHVDYPAIIASGAPSGAHLASSESVRGTYVEGLTEGDVYRLDQFEGDEYERREVGVVLLEEEEEEEEEEGGAGHGKKSEVKAGETRQAQTYVWVAGEHRLAKGEWDFDEFTREKLGRWDGSGPVHVESEELGGGKEEVSVGGEREGRDPTGGRSRFDASEFEHVAWDGGKQEERKGREDASLARAV